MLSAIIAAHNSERTLVPTLAALVPGATSGLLGEVIIADGGSSDATAEVADIAGCRFISSGEPLGTRLKAAALTTRTPWLMFLPAGCVPEPGWIAAADNFMEKVDRLNGPMRAAVFRPPGAGDLLHPRLSELAALVRVLFGGGARPEQGLLIARRFYDEIGGHTPDADADTALLRTIGRRRIAMLPAGAGTAR